MSHYESVPEPLGPVTLRQKPTTALVDRDAYAIAERATRDDFARVAHWVKFLGGESPFYNNDGVLVMSNYSDAEEGERDRYYEWVMAGSLLVHDRLTGEFTCYGFSMAEHYLLDPFTPHTEDPA